MLGSILSRHIILFTCLISYLNSSVLDSAQYDQSVSPLRKTPATKPNLQRAKLRFIYFDKDISKVHPSTIPSLRVVKFSLLSKHPSGTNTYGWARAHIVGALINCVFLLAICFSILIETLKRFITVHEVEHPKLVLAIGSLGCFVNFIGLILFYKHGFRRPATIRKDSCSKIKYESVQGAPNGHVPQDDCNGDIHDLNTDTTPILHEHIDTMINAESEKMEHTGDGDGVKCGKTEETMPLVNEHNNASNGRLEHSNDEKMGTHDLKEELVAILDKAEKNKDATHNAVAVDKNVNEPGCAQTCCDGARSMLMPADNTAIGEYVDKDKPQEVNAIDSGGIDFDEKADQLSEPDESDNVGTKPLLEENYDNVRSDVDKGENNGKMDANGSNCGMCSGEMRVVEVVRREPQITTEIDMDYYDVLQVPSSHMNMRAVLLHVFGDFLMSVIIIISALVIMHVQHDWVNYIDPTMSLVMVGVVVLTTVPLLKDSAMILLQTVPTHIQVKDIETSLKRMDGVLSVSNLHIWQLEGERIIGTAHITCNCPDNYMKLARDIKTLFHDEGIHSTTIQPEFVEDCLGSKCTVSCENEQSDDSTQTDRETDKQTDNSR